MRAYVLTATYTEDEAYAQSFLAEDDADAEKRAKKLAEDHGNLRGVKLERYTVKRGSGVMAAITEDMPPSTKRR